MLKKLVRIITRRSRTAEEEAARLEGLRDKADLEYNRQTDPGINPTRYSG